MTNTADTTGLGVNVTVSVTCGPAKQAVTTLQHLQLSLASPPIVTIKVFFFFFKHLSMYVTLRPSMPGVVVTSLLEFLPASLPGAVLTATSASGSW